MAVRTTSINCGFRGLDEQTEYFVEFQTDARRFSMTGLQLMRSGVLVLLPNSQSSEIIYASPISPRVE
jgi:hypothetical protein